MPLHDVLALFLLQIGEHEHGLFQEVLLEEHNDRSLPFVHDDVGSVTVVLDGDVLFPLPARHDRHRALVLLHVFDGEGFGRK